MCPMAQVMLWTSHSSEHVVVRGRLLWWRWWWRVTTPLLWLPRFPSIPSRRLDAGFAAIRHWIHLTLLCNIAKGKIISTLKGETWSLNRPPQGAKNLECGIPVITYVWRQMTFYILVAFLFGQFCVEN